MSDEPELKEYSSHAGGIQEAISRVMEEIAYLQKKKSSGVNYTFVGEAETIESVRPVLLRHGIVFYPHRSTEVFNERYTTGKGASMSLARLRVTWVFHHWPSGTQIEVETVSEAADSSDKASSKAHTIGLKYALRQTLLLQTGDDPDKDVNERATRKDLERQNMRQKYKETAIKRLMEAKSSGEVRELMENATLKKYPSIISEIRVLSERRIAELS